MLRGGLKLQRSDALGASFALRPPWTPSVPRRPVPDLFKAGRSFERGVDLPPMRTAKPVRYNRR
jgi:hypothetical protein